ncbi:cytosolic phospholipase A2 gamma [Spea bombifrons]|uniref:cytosolic phospholipase A2 gamma n=1 Tax=Spea bombifrons TaxID=233779 RepID=UPI00234B5F75|nr:cytosolic phospholipase A2 gamma [Spea bombifrons]
MDMSKEEQNAILARLKKVAEGFQKLGIKTNQDQVPVVAVLGSGGSLRAMIGLLGVLAEMADLCFLDTVTYLCGTSGSTWCMASLYNSANWSTCMEKMEHTICQRISNSKCDWKDSLEKLNRRVNKDTESLTSFWAYVVIRTMTKDNTENKLSDHRAACETGTNPYPIYSAVQKQNVDKKIQHDPGTWFEFTPHKAGFPAYNSFVDTQYLGCKFKEGKLCKITPERDLCFMQGLWGSALASKEAIWGILKDHIGDTFGKAACNKGVNTSDEYKEHQSKCKKCKSLHTLLSEEQQSMDYNMKEQLLLILRKFLDDNKEKESSSDFSTEEKVGSDDCEVWKVILNCLVSLAKWEWGTTYNFLYLQNESGKVPTELSSQEYIHLIDAGLEINSAYPLMLAPYRKVDLILSFDFSEGDPFMTIKQTAEYCEKNHIPFPKIHIQNGEDEQKSPSQNCYIFEGDQKDTPVVMHFPLFNNKSCGDKVEEWREKYSSMKMSFTNLEVNDLLHVSRENVKLSKNQILEKLRNMSK